MKMSKFLMPFILSITSSAFADLDQMGSTTIELQLLEGQSVKITSQDLSTALQLFAQQNGITAKKIEVMGGDGSILYTSPYTKLGDRIVAIEYSDSAVTRRRTAESFCSAAGAGESMGIDGGNLKNGVPSVHLSNDENGRLKLTAFTEKEHIRSKTHSLCATSPIKRTRPPCPNQLSFEADRFSISDQNLEFLEADEISIP